LSKTRKIIVTHALPYANAPLHLGHILESVQTDIWVRYQNQVGNECLFFCADDTHGTPVMLKAKELGIEAEDLVESVRKEHMETYKLYDINFTNYHSTHSDENKMISEEIYSKALNNSLIIKKNIEQYFDESEGMFLSDRFIIGVCPKCSAENQYGDGCEVCGATYSTKDLKEPLSKISETKPILKESEHIFFDLPKKEKMLKTFLDGVDIPISIKNKLTEWLNDLKPWDISRDAPYFGFKIPNEDNKYFYVWVDAPIGYIASLKNWLDKNNLELNHYWSENSEYEIVHFIGKDIAYFHGLFWPALLSAASLKLPDTIQVHGFLTVNGEKMSKSRGTGILTDKFAEHCEPELLRYYLASKLNNKVEDIDLNLDDLTQKINSDLVGKYLNIASRSSTFIQKNNGILGDTYDEDLINSLLANEDEIKDLYESRQYSKVVRLIMDMADSTNKYINDNTPWKLDINEAVIIATTAINAFKIISTYLYPITPKLVTKALKLLNIEDNSYKEINSKLISIKINKYDPLLTRMEVLKLEDLQNEENVMIEDETNLININQFADVELRVARIIDAEDIPDADKLIKIHLSVGELGKRTVFAGIKNSYNKDELTNKLVILVYNLAPRKMKFGVSEGMILASSDDNGIYLISPDDGAKEGQRVK